MVAVTDGGERQPTLIKFASATGLSKGSSTFLLPQLEAGSEARLSARFTRTPRLFEVFAWLAEARTRGSYESATRMDNNVARGWHVQITIDDLVPVRPDYSMTLASSEPVLAADGTQRANVTVLARFESTEQGFAGDRAAMDARVVMEYSPGLEADGESATFGLETGSGNVKQKSDLSYEAGVFHIGETLDGEEFRMTLPVRVTSGASLENPPCLTATIRAEPPAGFGPFLDDPTDNVDKVCFAPAPAGAPQVLFRSGKADLLTWYDCVGKSAPPCDQKDDGDAATNDDLQLAVFAGEAAEEYAILQPNQVVVHVPDPAGRSENRAGGLVWSTGFENWAKCTGISSNCLPGNKDRPGVVVRLNTALLDLRTVTDGSETPPDVDRWGTPDTTYPDWERGYFKVDMSGPGKMATWDSGSSGPVSEWGSSDAGYEGNPWITSSDKHLGYYDGFYIEFSSLGTYELSATIRTPYDDDVTDTTNGVEHSDKETYIFHVGPLADLSVAGGASPHAASGRSTLTVVAANNGPNHSLGTKVNGLPTGADVLHISQGRYDSATGVWNIGELNHRDYRRSAGQPEHVTLVLSASAGDTADVTITHSPDYSVCIDSVGYTLAHTNHADCKSDVGTTNVWHTAVCVKDSNQKVNTTTTHDTQTECEAQTGHTWTTDVCATSDKKAIDGRTEEEECDGWFQGTVYEYPNNNNEAKISARGGGAAGTSGGGGPVAPRFANTPVLTWEAVPHVNNWPVYRYQVQYLDGNTWQNLAHVSGDQTHFADTGAGARRSYRVRALNEAGIPGFWSRSASQVTYRQASPPLNVTAVSGYPGEVVVSWEPSSDDGGSPITYYQAQWSRNGTSGWSNACRSDSASQHTCTNTGIPSGETRYYRVAAYAGGLGAWSDLAVATTKAGVPEAPSLSASRATTGSGDDILRAIRLNWSQPRDNGSTIYAYEIDYVDYDQVARRCGTDWEALDGVGGPYSDSPVAREYLDAGNFGDGLEPGAYRCYRVRAVNSAGAGAWSNAASASAGGAVPPDEWLYLDGEADGQNAITLYWGEPHDDGGAPVTGYQLQYSEDGENWRNLTTTSASARSYTHTGRKVGETWHYQIRARNSAGWGGWSYPVTVTIEEGATANLSQPTLTAQARTSTEVLLSWNSLCNPNREGDCEGKGVDGYMVEYSDDGGLYGWERLTWLWTDQTKVLDSTVEPGATRYYRVAGYKEENRRQLLGRWSQVKSATTADFSVGAPENFTVVAEGERALKLEWEKPIAKEGDDSDSITGYRIERSTWNGEGPGDFDTSWVVRQTNRGIGPYVETGLTPNTQYYYQVAAVTRNGAVPYIGPYAMVSIFIPPAGN